MMEETKCKQQKARAQRIDLPLCRALALAAALAGQAGLNPAERVRSTLSRRGAISSRSSVIYCGAVRIYPSLHNLRRSYFTCHLLHKKIKKG